MKVLATTREPRSGEDRIRLDRASNAVGMCWKYAPGGTSLNIERLMAVMVLSVILACRTVAQESATPASKTSGSTSGEAATRFFESKVRPILAEHCYRCHGPDSGDGKAKLRVDSLESLLKGGVSGPAIVRGEPDQSLLILAVRHEGDVSMPPKKKLPQADIDVLAAWVKMGAPWTPPPAPVVPAGNVPRWGEAARQVLGVPGPSGPETADGRRCAMAPISHRPLHPGATRGRGAASGASGRQADPPPACEPRSPGNPSDSSRNWTRSYLMTLPMRSNASWTGCSHPPDTENAGAGTGWTSSDTPTPTAWTITSPTPTPGGIAIM